MSTEPELTAESRAVLELSLLEAHSCGVSRVMSGHLLKALIAYPKTVALFILSECKIDVRILADELQRNLDLYKETQVSSTDIAAEAREIAKSFGSLHIDTDHLLISALEHADSIVVSTLAHMGVAIGYVLLRAREIAGNSWGQSLPTIPGYELVGLCEPFEHGAVRKWLRDRKNELASTVRAEVAPDIMARDITRLITLCMGASGAIIWRQRVSSNSADCMGSYYIDPRHYREGATQSLTVAIENWFVRSSKGILLFQRLGKPVNGLLEVVHQPLQTDLTVKGYLGFMREVGEWCRTGADQ
jgi:hypothetical protein